MAENPNTQPGFIRIGGILGNPVKLSNQVCTRDAPGNIPLVLYDTQGTYTSGNGAIAENLVIVPTGVVAKSTLLIFVKDLSNSTPEFLLYEEVDLPALASIAATAKPAEYPLKATLTREIYRSLPAVGSNAFPRGIRIPGNSASLQYGVALGTAIGTLPVIIYLEGGEL